VDEHALPADRVFVAAGGGFGLVLATGCFVVGFGDAADVLGTDVLGVVWVALLGVGRLGVVLSGTGTPDSEALDCGALRARRSAAETCPPPGVVPVSHTRATSPRAASTPAPTGSRHDSDRERCLPDILVHHFLRSGNARREFGGYGARKAAPTLRIGHGKVTSE
jgi:hypothetical protein